MSRRAKGDRGGPQTPYQKIWHDRIIMAREDGTCLARVDRHLTHEVTNPQAFAQRAEANRDVRRPALTSGAMLA